MLNDKHFVKVSKASRSFDKYLGETYSGSTEGERALELGERADHWKEDDEDGKKKRESQKRKAKKEKERLAGMNVADFGRSKKGKKAKKSKKEESSSGSESEDLKPWKQNVDESESESED